MTRYGCVTCRESGNETVYDGSECYELDHQVYCFVHRPEGSVPLVKVRQTAW